eukprot:TRINITY_DN5059_c0_g1_i1.p1 TRINITY_DN5059_c0_g1~~TRINITY_DN5059_c0_g1_i1.p1  ORF type:complete len:398 (-),score=74.92 TRINITY_DN5059_c0_g1_i1:75-1268(-)
MGLMRSSVLGVIILVNVVMFVLNSTMYISRQLEPDILRNKQPYETKVEKQQIVCPECVDCPACEPCPELQLPPPLSNPEQCTTPSQLTTSSSSPPAKDKIWLGIVMPSIPRPKNTTYIDIVFDSVLKALPDNPSHPWWGSIKVYLINNHFPGEHLEFNRVKKKMENHPKSSFFEFLENDRRLKEREKANKAKRSMIGDGDEDDDSISVNKGRKLLREIWGDEQEQIRRETQQTLDLVANLRMLENKAEHFMFMEDDMTLCPSGIEAIMHALDKANRRNWRALRFSFGLNGILIRNSDINSLNDYWLKYGTGGPNHQHSPDMLVLAYWAGGGLNIFGHNLMEHQGYVSTFADREHATNYLKCWENNRFWPQYNAAACTKDDLQPCTNDDIYVRHGHNF